MRLKFIVPGFIIIGIVALFIFKMKGQDTASKTIGSEGGSVSLDDGSRINVPEGIINGEVIFTLKKTE